MDEIWMPVPGYGGYYEASSLGNIRAKEREVTKRTRHGGVMVQRYAARLLNPTVEKGYLRVHLGFEGRKVKAWVHGLVLRAFSGEPADGQITRHLNGNRQDNRPGNLQWGSHLENMADRKSHGNYLDGANHCMAKLTADQVATIRKSDMTGAALGKIFGVSESQISRIRRGESWRQPA